MDSGSVYENERNVLENASSDDPQDEEFFNGMDYTPEGLESGGVGGSDEYFEGVEEGSNTVDFRGESGYINNDFGEGGYIRYDHDAGDNGYGDNGYDYGGYD